MIPQDIKAILEGLLERSRKKEVEWLDSRTTRTGYGDYVVIFQNSSLVIWENRDETEFGGRIFNNRGDIVASFDATPSDTGSYQLLQELIELARRKVLRTDETIAEIQRAIEVKPRVGEVPSRSTGAVDDDVPF